MTEKQAWLKDKKYVLNSIKDLRGDVKELHTKLDNHASFQTETMLQVRLDIKELKTKIALWAAVVVAVGTIASPLISEALTQLFR